MRMAILIAVMLAFATSSAEARKKKHRLHAHHVTIYSTLVGPSALAMQNRDALRKYQQRRGATGYESAADPVPADRLIGLSPLTRQPSPERPLYRGQPWQRKIGAVFPRPLELG